MLRAKTFEKLFIITVYLYIFIIFKFQNFTVIKCFSSTVLHNPLSFIGIYIFDDAESVKNKI